MLGYVESMKRSLEQVKDAVQASIQSERVREGAKAKGTFEEDHHDVPMYDNGMKPQYTMTEVKKRRGVSNPPQPLRKHYTKNGQLTASAAGCSSWSMP
jgi:hypothetical protein